MLSRNTSTLLTLEQKKKRSGGGQVEEAICGGQEEASYLERLRHKEPIRPILIADARAQLRGGTLALQTQSTNLRPSEVVVLGWFLQSISCTLQGLLHCQRIEL